MFMGNVYACCHGAEIANFNSSSIILSSASHESNEAPSSNIFMETD